MEVLNAVIDCLLFALFFFSVKYVWNLHRKKNIFIIEDNPFDESFIRVNLSVKNARFITCKNYNDFIVQRLLRSPDAVIIDYRLPGTMGDKIFKLCKSQAIPSVVITADITPIFGIPESCIIRKKGNYAIHLKKFIQHAIYDHALNPRV